MHVDIGIFKTEFPSLLNIKMRIIKYYCTISCNHLQYLITIRGEKTSQLVEFLEVLFVEQEENKSNSL